MAITPPTIHQSVYNRIPYLVVDNNNDGIIDAFTAEIMGELYKPFGIEEDDMLDDTKYNILQKALVADLVSIQLITRRVLVNSEGDGVNAATGNKVLKRAKAGEAETEFHGLKASDGVKLLASAESIKSGLMSDAMRRARSLGFILDLNLEGQFVIQAMSRPNCGLAVINWED